MECKCRGTLRDRDRRQDREIRSNVDNPQPNPSQNLEAERLSAATVGVEVTEETSAKDHDTPREPHLRPVLARLLHRDTRDDTCRADTEGETKAVDAGGDRSGVFAALEVYRQPVCGDGDQYQRA